MLTSFQLEFYRRMQYQRLLAIHAWWKNYSMLQSKIMLNPSTVIHIKVFPKDVLEVLSIILEYGYVTIYSSIGVISLGRAAKANDNSLTYISIPLCLHISELAFFNCKNLEVVDFSLKIDKEVIPTLADVNAFIDENGLILNKLQIIVPDDLYDKWIVAGNWVALKNNIHRKSDYGNTNQN